jgi:hypothetical protein
VFSMESDRRVYNKYLFAVGVIREFELEDWVEFWRVCVQERVSSRKKMPVCQIVICELL